MLGVYMGIDESVRDYVLRGLEDLRKGSLAMLIAQILSIAVIVVLVVSLFPLLGALPFIITTPQAPPYTDLIRSLTSLRFLLALLIAMGIFGLASLIFTIYAIYIKFIPGSSKLRRWSADFSTPSMLMKIGYIGGLIVIVVGIVIMMVLAITLLPTMPSRGAFSSPMDFLRFLAPLFGGIAIVFIGGLLWLIGNIGLIILFFKLHTIFKEMPLLIAAIIFIILIVSSFIAAIPFIGMFISIAISILPLVAWLLSYIGLGNIVRKIHSQTIEPVAV